MTNQNLPTVGVRAVFQDLSKFLNASKQYNDATAKVLAAQNNLALVTERTATRIALAERAVERARSQAAQSATKSAEIQARAAQRLADAELRLASIRRQQNLQQTGAQLRVAAAQSAVPGAPQFQTQTKTGTAALVGFAAANKLASGSVNQFGQSLIAATGYSNRFAVSLKFGAAAVASFIAAFAANEVSQFQNTLIKIDNLTQLNTADTKKLSQGLLELSKTVPKTPNELGAVAYEALSRGISDVDEALKLTEVASKAAVAGFGNEKDIIIAVTGVLNSYGKENITAKQAAEILFATVKVGGGEFNDYAQNIGRVTQLSRTLGVTFDQVGAAVATLTNVGLPANQAVTALLGILNQIVSPSREAEQILIRAGTSIAELRENIAEKGLIPALQELFALLGKNIEVIETLFPEVRGLSGGIALLGEATDEYNNNLGIIQKSVGIVEESFNRAQKSFSSQAQLLKNSVNRALIELGTQVLPTVATEMGNLTEFIEENKQGIADFGRQAAEIGIDITKSFIEGIRLITEFVRIVVLGYGEIIGKGPAAAAALAALGTALLWALPGGPILKGLGLVVTAIGTISRLNKDGFEITATTRPELQRVQAELEAKLSKTGTKGIEGDIRAVLEEALVEVKKRLSDLSAEERKAAEDAENLRQQLNALTPTFDNADKEAEKLRQEIEDLSQDFRNSSQAAGQVKSLTEELGLFGEVSFDLAQKLGLSATQAGNIQGIDAVVNAFRRADVEAFNFTKTLATVAQAFQRSAAVGNQIVLGLARSALAAAQAAQAALFGRPTQEVANANVALARQNLANSQTAAGVNPQVRALQSQLEQINRQIQAVNKASQASSAAASFQKSQNDKIINAANRQLDELRFQHLKERIAYERMNANLERLIDATRERASDLQKTFLKNNEELQRQINEAIGAGDTGTALELVDQQQEAAKAYHNQARALQENEQQLIKRQKRAALEEEEAQRKRQLEEAEMQRRVQSIENRIRENEAINQTSNAYDSQIVALENQRAAIQAQIDSLTLQTEAGDNAAAAIEEQIAVYEAQSALLDAMVTAADNTLLTQSEQTAAAYRLITQVNTASAAVRTYAQLTGEELIPELQASNEAYALLRDAIRTVTDEGFRNNLIDRGIDPAAQRLEILADAAGDSATASRKAADADSKQAAATAQLSKYTQQQIDAVQDFISRINQAPSGGGGGGGGGGSFAEGGLFNRPSRILVGETHQLEGVIPFERPRRARQLLASVPPALLAAAMPRGNSPAVFAPNISVNGETLDTMRAMAIQAVDQAFRNASIKSHRSGGLISQGLGPSR